MLRRFRVPASAAAVFSFAPRLHMCSTQRHCSSSVQQQLQKNDATFLRPVEMPPDSTSASAPPSPAAAAAVSCTLLQRYIQPGVLKKHPLQLMRQVASEQLSAAKKDDDDGSTAVTITSWSVEEIQMVTADAARRLAAVSRHIVDDDVDLGATIQAPSAAASGIDSIGASVISGDSEAAAAAFVEEQRHFDELHATLFKSVDASGSSNNTIADKIEEWFLYQRQKQRSRGEVDDDDDDNGTITAEEESELACLVSLLQRHLLLARLCSRFDAAVESFLLLVSVRDRGMDVIYDEKELTSLSRRRSHRKREESAAGGAKVSELRIPIVSWRQLRDVVQACAAASTTSVGTVAAATTESNYKTAETLVRLIMRKYSNDVQQIVTVDVMQSLSKCIQNASDLQRFRELMAVECSGDSSSSSSSGGGGGGGDVGALAHIPVSVSLYNEIILACSRCNDEPRRVPVALAVFRAIGDNGLRPTAQTYAGIVAVYAAEGLCNEAFAMFHEAKSRCDKAAVAACPALYNHLIESYANAGKLHDAVSTTNVLIDAHAPLTRRGFHAALACCAVQGDLSQVHDFLAVMQGGAGAVQKKMSSSYSVPATPTTLAVALASLFFIRKEMKWREKLTLVGDFTSDALALLPLSATALHEDDVDVESGAGDNQKFRQEQKQVAVFCETEGFYCAVLNRVLGSIAAAPVFSAAAISANTTSSSSTGGTGEEEEGSAPTKHDEAGLYRHHLNLSLRLMQMHCQLTLCNLLERAVERRVTIPPPAAAASAAAAGKNSSRLEQDRAERRKRFAKSLLEQAKTGELFAPQTPTRMPLNAEVAALLPDVILNPGLLSSAESSSSSSSVLDEIGLEEADPNALLHLLQSVLPRATVFLLPFASVRAIVTEADALLHLNNSPLLQREMFADSASLSMSLVGATAEARKQMAAVRAATGTSGGGGSSTNAERIIDVSEQTSSSAAAVYPRATEAGSLSHTEREARLDRLADSVLALAVFLKHHGSKVHVQSATNDLDSSRAVSTFHLDSQCPVQTAAAASLSLLLCSSAVFAPGALRSAAESNDKNHNKKKRKLLSDENNKNNLNASFDLVHAARGHKWFCERAKNISVKHQKPNNNALLLSRSSPPLCNFVGGVAKQQPELKAILQQQQQQQQSPDTSSSSSAVVDVEAEAVQNSLLASLPPLLYFRAKANISLVTCDSALKRKWNKSVAQKRGEVPVSKFRETAETLQMFHQDAAKMLLPTSATRFEQQQQVASHAVNDSLFRSISGIKLSSLQQPQRERRRQQHSQQQPPPPREQHRGEEKGFRVRVIDPTEMML